MSLVADAWREGMTYAEWLAAALELGKARERDAGHDLNDTRAR